MLLPWGVDSIATLLAIWIAIKPEYRNKIIVRRTFCVGSGLYIISSILLIFGKSNTDKELLKEYSEYSHRGVNNETINQLIDSYNSSVIIQSCITCVFFIVAIVLLCFVFNIKTIEKKFKYILSLSIILLFTIFAIIPTSYSSIQKYSFREDVIYDKFPKYVTVNNNGISEIHYDVQPIAVNSSLEYEIIDTIEFNILGLFLLLEIITVFVVLVLLDRSSYKETNTIEIEMQEGNDYENQI